MPAVLPTAHASLAHTPEWKALQQSAMSLTTSPVSIKAQFADDPQRHARYSVEAAGIVAPDAN